MNFLNSHSRFEPLPMALHAVHARSPKHTVAGSKIADAQSLSQMLDDAQWSLPDGMRERGRALLAYLCAFDDLIPDDAVLDALGWSEFSGEVQDYQDFRRFCSASPGRGSADERRSEWERECLAEASTMLHRQAVRERGYARALPYSRPFRVC